MLRTEFEKLTKIYPSTETYKVIEQFYAEYVGDKYDFCNAYTKNIGGLAEKIQKAVNNERIAEEQKAEKAQKMYERRIAELEKALEQVQRWKPYVDTNNVPQETYEKLIHAGGTKYLTEEAAKALLFDWYGFSKEEITIHTEIPKYEVNRDKLLRKVGTIDRRPAYNATDWNYIRFDCKLMAYEVCDGNLRFWID